LKSFSPIFAPIVVASAPVNVVVRMICGGMIYGLDTTTQVAAAVWMVIGLVVYFAYAKSHSRLNA